MGLAVVHPCYEIHSDDDDDDNHEQDTDQHQLSPWQQHSGGWKTSVHLQLCDVSSEIVEQYLNIIICEQRCWGEDIVTNYGHAVSHMTHVDNKQVNTRCLVEAEYLTLQSKQQTCVTSFRGVLWKLPRFESLLLLLLLLLLLFSFCHFLVSSSFFLKLLRLSYNIFKVN